MHIEPQMRAVHRVTGGVLGGCGIPRLHAGAPHSETGAAFPDWQNYREQAPCALSKNGFGISPDGGDGSLEIIILVLLVVLATLIGMLLPIGGKAKEEGEN